jgi:hypothetical protein
VAAVEETDSGDGGIRRPGDSSYQSCLSSNNFRSTQEHIKDVQDAPSSSVILYMFRDGGALACGAKSVGELT